MRVSSAAPVLVVLALGTVVGVACSGDDDGATGPAETTSVTSTTAAEDGSGAMGVPAEVADHEDDWPTAGQDFDNTRAAADSTITAA
ncbi:MAG TPA: hypothetical protein VID94_17150, partial [Acidimicrobiales bacterium]